MRCTIALDAMGGDHGAAVVVPAALQILEKYDELRLILVGDSQLIALQLKRLGVDTHPRLKVFHAEETIAMDESPLIALRTKKKSSMRLALNLVKEGQASACVSAGNTGALLAIARFVLKTLPGIDRPAIMRTLPTDDPKKHVRILDLGANVDSTPEHLLQFAIMGSAVARAIDHQTNPRIGLLNIGEEEIKGNELVKQTAVLLKQCQEINYIGFVEADKMYFGKTDVIVCDGFIGNIALKVTEGVAKLIMSIVKGAFRQNIFTKLIGLGVMLVLRPLRKTLDPSRYNGASLVGLNGIVIKSHGSANSSAFAHAIEVAMLEVENNVPMRIRDQLAQLEQLITGAEEE